MSMEPLGDLTVLGFLALLLAAAVTDLRSYRIPNAIPLGVAILFLPHALSAATSVQAAWALLCGLAVFLLGCAAFRAGVLGGGDVKLLAAASLWAGPSLLLPFLQLTALSGGIFAVALLMHRRWMRTAAAPSDMTQADPASGKLPYGVPIAIGGAWVCLQLLTR